MLRYALPAAMGQSPRRTPAAVYVLSHAAQHAASVIAARGQLRLITNERPTPRIGAYQTRALCICPDAPVAKIYGRNSEMVGLFAATTITARGSEVGMTLCCEIALNPYKEAIFPHGRVIKSSLVHYGIDAMKGASNNEFRMKLSMKANLKIVLSALALAALVAAPGVAKSGIFALFFAGSAAPADWKEYENPEYSFAISFPVDPTREATTFRTADGRSLEAHTFSVEQKAGVFKVTVVEMPGQQTGEEASVVKDAAKNVAEGGVIKFDMTHSVRDIYGRQLGIAGANGGYSYVALFYHKQRLYQIEGKAFVAGGQAELDAMRFHQSFDLT